jgi:hypothetical protein
MRVKLTFYDERTGEILAEEDRGVIFGKKPYIDKGFAKFFVAFLRDLIEDEEVLKGPVRLFLYAVDKADFNSLRVSIVPQEAIRDLDISKATFYNWLKVLLDKGYLEKLAVNIYRLKPYTVVKGQMAKAIETEPDF